VAALDWLTALDLETQVARLACDTICVATFAIFCGTQVDPNAFPAQLQNQETNMRAFAIAVGTAAALAFSAAGSMAQDSTTTTTTVHHDEVAPGPGLTVGVPGVAGVHVGGPPVESGCTTKRSTTTDNDTGASTTVKRSDC
jgi:hypothetical protein